MKSVKRKGKYKGRKEWAAADCKKGAWLNLGGREGGEVKKKRGEK